MGRCRGFFLSCSNRLLSVEIQFLPKILIVEDEVEIVAQLAPRTAEVPYNPTLVAAFPANLKAVF